VDVAPDTSDQQEKKNITIQDLFFIEVDARFSEQPRIHDGIKSS